MVLAVFGANTLADTPTAPSAAVRPTTEETAVLAAMDRYLAAISASDLDTMAAMQTPDGVNYRALALPSGGMEILGRPNSYWVDPARKDGHTYRERYWAPTVLVRGSIAIVWAPYEFWIDGKTSHCGIDVFNFINVGNAWHVANSMWTVEPDACPELRPSDPGSIRPAG
jgi:ketosteroid isomerase-like protein